MWNHATRVGVVLLWACLCMSVWAQGMMEAGYIEGTILAIDNDVAQVRLENSQEVSAQLLWYDEFGDYPLPSFQVGQQVELYYTRYPDGSSYYEIIDWVRRPVLYWLAALFVLVTVITAKLRGLRAIVATALSLFIIVRFVVPGILAGDSPSMVALLGAGGILIAAIFFVHGVSWSTLAALLGTAAAVVLTLLLGVMFIEASFLTGFGSSEAMLIYTLSRGMDLQGLVLAGLVVGALGALTDVTVVQASVVRELAYINPAFGLRDLYQRGMNVGREHVGTLVNTLVLAYTGAALPLLLLLHLNEFALARALNMELVATQIVHTLVGSVGLIAAVPLTTLIAALLFRGDALPVSAQELRRNHSHALGQGAFLRMRQLEMLSSVSYEEAKAELLRRQAQRASRLAADKLTK